ncbi:MAG TPA: sigma-70 family RNA polymerase sigma factor [Polyangiaceae bacterium]
MLVTSSRLVAKLEDPSLAAGLSHFVRARVPDADVEDIVQSTLTEALDADSHPDDEEEIVRWVYGICRHKVVDWFRRMKREVPRDLESSEEGAPVAAAESAPQSAMDLLRWAKKELPQGEENAKTLEWMLREGEGEKLETIAAEENLPAPRVRQRVSRLRRYYKARWAAQAAALAALLLIALAIALALRQRHEEVAPAPGPSFLPVPLVPTQPPPPPSELPAMSNEPPQLPPPVDSTNDLKPTPLPAPVSTDRPPPAKKPRAKPMNSKVDSNFGGGGSRPSFGDSIGPPPDSSSAPAAAFPAPSGAVFPSKKQAPAPQPQQGPAPK